MKALTFWPLWHCTGGTRSVNLARQECHYPGYGQRHDFMTGGPIDAPDVMPAGSYLNRPDILQPGHHVTEMTYTYRPGSAPWPYEGEPA